MSNERTIPSIHAEDHTIGGPDPIPSLAMWPIKVGRDNLQVQTGDARFVWEIPEDLDGHVLMKVAAFISNPGSGTTEVMIRDVQSSIDILSTPITIDSGEKSSKTAATLPVVDPTYAEVAWGQQLAIDVDSAAVGATGLGVYFYFLASPDAVGVVTGPPGTNGTNGTNGTDGADGADGADGVGVPAGGTTGQILAKASGTDYDDEWIDPPTSGAGDPVFDALGTPDTAFEFDTSSLTGLTALGSIDAEDADTTVPDHYYIRDDDNSGWVGRYLSVSPACTIVAKLADREIVETDGTKYGLFIGNTTLGSGNMDCVLVGNASNQIWVELAQTANVYSGARFIGSPLYLAIRANSSSDVDYLISHNGLVWKKVVDSRNPGIGTLARAGIGICPGSAGLIAAAYDYLRVWNSAKSFPGALA